MTKQQTVVAGPFDKQDAEDTARALGIQYSVYGVERKDSEGYGTDEYDYFVERDDSIMPDKLFGYDVNVLLAKQYR